MALANRKLARSGGDPLAARSRAEGLASFEEAAEKMVAIHSGACKEGGKSVEQVGEPPRVRLTRASADKRVDQVTTADVMAVVLPISC